MIRPLSLSLSLSLRAISDVKDAPKEVKDESYTRLSKVVTTTECVEGEERQGRLEKQRLPDHE